MNLENKALVGIFLCRGVMRERRVLANGEEDEGAERKAVFETVDKRP